MGKQDEASGSHPLERIHPRSLKHLSDRLQTLLRARLWLQILIGMFLGLFVGWLLSPSFGALEPDTGETVAAWLAIPGHLFITMIQMIVVPLIFASIIRGIAASEDVQQLRTTGSRLLLFFLLTTALAVVIGIGTGLVLEPGQYVDATPLRQAEAQLDLPLAEEGDGGLDLQTLPEAFVDVLPANPLREAVESNMLQIVLFSIVVGLALVSLEPGQSKPLLDLLGSLQSVCMTVVKWTMLIAPLAVFGLMVQLIVRTGLDALAGIGAYVVAVLVGLVVLMCVYLAIAWVFARRGPISFLRATRDVLLLAFSTDSSVAVMPLTVKTTEEKLGVRPSIAQFVVPVGATMNMGGSALFQGVATMFMAQIYGIDLPVGMLAVLLLTAIGASIGTPATPGVGVIVLSAVLTGVGVPIGGIALIVGVDRILEMFRTSVNVTGDMVASVVMERVVGRKTPLTAVEEQRAEVELEQVRAEQGQDTLVDDQRVTPPAS